MCACNGVHVTVREKQRYAMLFQSVVLPCQYQTASTQTPVVQWWYKSYCRDRSRESFSLPESLAVQASELGAASHLECSDSSRTVRVVASAQGASMTLAEHYKGRDISIVNSNALIITLDFNLKRELGKTKTGELLQRLAVRKPRRLQCAFPVLRINPFCLPLIIMEPRRTHI